MIQKLPKLYYGKVRSEHERWSRSKGIEVPEEDMKLNQQMATSPDLSKYLSQGEFSQRLKRSKRVSC